MTWRGRGRPPRYKVPRFSKFFQEQYRLTKNKSRSRKFTPKTFFMTMLHLCSGKNKEGYLHALFKSFNAAEAPAKGSLSKMRKKISYAFFRDTLSDLLTTFKRPTWRGLHLYATDGFEAAIPRTKEIFEAGYRGKRIRSKGKKGETYYPHMYTVHTYDILSRTTKSICFGAKNNEIAGALMNIQEL